MKSIFITAISIFLHSVAGFANNGIDKTLFHSLPEDRKPVVYRVFQCDVVKANGNSALELLSLSGQTLTRDECKVFFSTEENQYLKVKLVRPYLTHPGPRVDGDSHVVMYIPVIRHFDIRPGTDRFEDMNSRDWRYRENMALDFSNLRLKNLAPESQIASVTEINLTNSSITMIFSIQSLGSQGAAQSVEMYHVSFVDAGETITLHQR